MTQRLPPLWQCPKCGERFVTKNMWHSCGKYTLEALFARSEPHVRQLFDTFAEMIRSCGPVTTIPQKTRVVFQVRVRFGGCYPRKSHLVCSLALPRVDDDPRFFKIEKFAAHFIGHSFRVYSEADLDADLQRWMRDAYEVGEQKHLKGTGKPKRAPVARAPKESKDTRPSSLSKRGQT